ncbi:PQQ-dependent sugar dehydrogenase [Roseomonas sp. BN140053]|uniref:PQQ-dependent sugar dehydrogenase n=1 Tax=Roseomonas sp. BN140053 TaxID=3391898 RepID=UPI0039EC71AC
MTLRRMLLAATMFGAMGGAVPLVVQAQTRPGQVAQPAPIQPAPIQTAPAQAAPAQSTAAPSTAAQPAAAQPAATPRVTDQTIGQRFTVRADALPAPYQDTSLRNPPLIVPRDGRVPQVPDGFEVTLVAENLQGPRQLLVLPNGDLLVVAQAAGALMLLRDADGDGKAEWIQRWAGGFDRPNSIALRDGELLITDQQGIWRMAYQPGQAVRPPSSPGVRRAADTPPEQRRPRVMDEQTLISARGAFGMPVGHINRDIEIGPDGRLYVGVGSSGNIGVEPEPKATIQVFSPDGREQRTFASGVRNPVGLAFHPQTGDLWAAVQERDGVGDRLVPDFLARMEQGAFFGWPYAYVGQNPQPGFAQMAPERVAASRTPELLFEPHSAAMDFIFWHGPRVPAGFSGDAIVALRGSWNRAAPTGYKVVRVKFEGGRPVGWYDNFMTGFWVDGEETAEVWGRPVDVAQAPDGALYVVDDTAGTIWRVTARAAR